MHIELKRLDDAYHFEASNEDGNTVVMDGSVAIGGKGLGARPMQLLLMGIGGCSGIDIVSILKKQKQVITGFDISIDGEREVDVVPALFENIAVHFQLEGALDAAKVKRAVMLSMDKYCSVSKIIEKSAKITYRVSLNGEVLD
jgi:putative redox protein